jgi:hypothetical protein
VCATTVLVAVAAVDAPDAVTLVRARACGSL